MITFLNCKGETVDAVSDLLNISFPDQVISSTQVHPESEVIIITELESAALANTVKPTARIMWLTDNEDIRSVTKLNTQYGISVAVNPENMEAIIDEVAELKKTKKDLRGYSAQVAPQVQIDKAGTTVIEGFKIPKIIFKSNQMLMALTDLARFSKFREPLLITGENGVGKGAFFEAFVANYKDKNPTSPIVEHNMAAIPKDLMDTALFGNVKGAFTGATNDTPGLFERASGGVLILDEFGEMPMEMQAKILTVLEKGTYSRVGETGKEKKVNFQLVTATNQDLPKMIKEGKFREDLYNRINGCSIHIPSLKERKEDIPLLIQDTLLKFEKKYKDQQVKVVIEKDAVETLSKMDWPGNVRQLQNALKNLAMTCEGGMITHEQVIRDFSRGDDYKKSLIEKLQSPVKVNQVSDNAVPLNG